MEGSLDDRDDITDLLNRHAESSEATPVSDEFRASIDAPLVPLIYGHLKRLAHRQLRKLPSGETLCTTALVHEGYIKIFSGLPKQWRDRRHFLAAAAQAMRHILVDAARHRMTERQGAGQEVLPLLVEPVAQSGGHAADVLEIHRALEELAKIDDRLCRVVECRYFAGMTDEETAEALDVSARTVHRDWLRARAWLRRVLL